MRELELKVKQLQEENSERRDIAARDPAVDQLGVTSWSSVVANGQTNKRSDIQDGPIQVILGSTHERNAFLKIASKLRLNPANNDHFDLAWFVWINALLFNIYACTIIIEFYFSHDQKNGHWP